MAVPPGLGDAAAAAAAQLLDTADHCDFDVVRLEELEAAPHLFLERYLSPGKPVLIKGALERWPRTHWIWQLREVRHYYTEKYNYLTSRDGVR